MLKNQKIILTGANSGIGLETLKLLAEESSNEIFAVDIRIDNLHSFPNTVHAYRCDVSR